MEAPIEKPIRQRVDAAVILAGLLAFSSAHAADLTVKIGGLKSAAGNVRVGLFDTATGFPKKQLRGELVEAKPGVVTAVFKAVPAGAYAVSAFQDINGNKKLDTNAFGKPNEPYGFSRNARGMFGPPSFEEASFKVEDHDSSIDFDLK